VDTDESAIASFIEHARDEFLLHFDNFAFSRAWKRLSIIARVDKMIQRSKAVGSCQGRESTPNLNAILYRSAETLRCFVCCCMPLLPMATEEIYFQLGCDC